MCRIMKRTILIYIIAVFSVLASAFCVIKICEINNGYLLSKKEFDEIKTFKPVATENSNVEISINSSIGELKKKHPDIIGWITFPNTKIDYPFVQTKDNKRYLNKNLDLKYSVAGTPFLDCLSQPDLTGYASIIYGHNMKDGSMFSDIKKYRQSDFFTKNQLGYLFLPDKTLQLKVVCWCVVDSEESSVYKNNFVTDNDKQMFWETVQKNNCNIDFSETDILKDNYLILSTCSYEWKSARMLLISKIL